MKCFTSSLALLAALLIPLSVLAEKGPAVKDYPVDRVAEDVYVIHGPLGTPGPENQGFMNNPAFAVTDEGVVVIDPGASVQSGEMLLRVMAKVTKEPIIAVFNTHIHGDHWLGNQAIRDVYPDVPIYGHPKMISLIESGSGQSWVDLMERLTEGKTKGTRVVGPNKAVKNGDEFKFGGMTFRIHHFGKAHTTSDVMIEIPERSIAFLGDNVLNNRVPRIDEGSIQGNIEACKRIMETGAKIYVPGHGPTGDASVPEKFQYYLKTLYSTVKKYYDDGVSDYAMKGKVVEALDAYSEWSGFEKQVGKHVSLAYLQIEEAEFQ
ncbi:glyoxylase-like metal-dependent hydrolase (beta-lactamase superfamily II) [Thiogranum longum]|uniref:Glyoxylase-like metal-dependent hydrolase (Beta-lactamase superfamily II) n=1 Tax=Thiogranum longum TaxID=1537524 RepID=A0A4R1HID0_9GAMM|nr:MBL fold metallo-hydrolase [Thiogranum longum]TCK16962.1 glyoxylase-like metal-dependent hydrolase (beta-lactamase superfamily II) [Thiogranum longum]